MFIRVSTWKQEKRLKIEKTYQVRPKMTYSKCFAQPGWNVKYQKSGKSPFMASYYGILLKK